MLPRPCGQFWMIRRFTSAQFVPANAGAKAKNPVGSTLFSTPMVALLRHPGHKILRTCCRESVRKRLIPGSITLRLHRSYPLLQRPRTPTTATSAGCAAAGVPPVHQSPTENVPRLERLFRRPTRSPLAEHTDQARKAPGNAAFPAPASEPVRLPKAPG